MGSTDSKPYTGRHRPKTAVDQAAAAMRRTLRDQLDAAGLNTYTGRHRAPEAVAFAGSSRVEVSR